jgi:hypothetical protein
MTHILLGIIRIRGCATTSYIFFPQATITEDCEECRSQRGGALEAGSAPCSRQAPPVASASAPPCTSPWYWEL